MVQPEEVHRPATGSVASRPHMPQATVVDRSIHQPGMATPNHPVNQVATSGVNNSADGNNDVAINDTSDQVNYLVTKIAEKDSEILQLQMHGHLSEQELKKAQEEIEQLKTEVTRLREDIRTVRAVIGVAQSVMGRSENDTHNANGQLRPTVVPTGQVQSGTQSRALAQPAAGSAPAHVAQDVGEDTQPSAGPAAHPVGAPTSSGMNGREAPVRRHHNSSDDSSPITTRNSNGSNEQLSAIHQSGHSGTPARATGAPGHINSRDENNSDRESNGELRRARHFLPPSWLTSASHPDPRARPSEADVARYMPADIPRPDAGRRARSLSGTTAAGEERPPPRTVPLMITPQQRAARDAARAAQDAALQAQQQARIPTIASYGMVREPRSDVVEGLADLPDYDTEAVNDEDDHQLGPEPLTEEERLDDLDFYRSPGLDYFGNRSAPVSDTDEELEPLELDNDMDTESLLAREEENRLLEDELPMDLESTIARTRTEPVHEAQQEQFVTEGTLVAIAQEAEGESHEQVAGENDYYDEELPVSASL
jgi:hypothetical protein